MGWPFVGCVAFVAVGLLLLVTGEVLGGLPMVLFFGYLLVAYTARLMWWGPELVIDDAGLDHVFHGRVPWEQVAYVTGGTVLDDTVWFDDLEVVLHAPVPHRHLLPRLLGLLSRRNGQPPTLTITSTTLDASPNEVAAAMLRHHPDLVVR